MISMDLIYLDNNSTTPLLPEVRAAMEPYLSTVYGNPASAHRAGRLARRALEDAREQVASLLDADPEEVVFTSGATESNNLALHGLAGDPPGHVISSPIEHPSVSEVATHLAARGLAVSHLPVTGEGIVRAESLEAMLQPDTRLVTVMLANNETGALQPVAELAQLSAGRTSFHCDAVQAASKIPVRFHELGVTTLSLSAHKFHGPKGAGALLIRRGCRFPPLFHGGHQQRGNRPGTESVALAVGLAKALEIACRDMETNRAKVLGLRRRFVRGLGELVPPVVINGPDDIRLPHTLNVSFPGCRADSLLMNLDLAGVACSTGSACSSGSLLPSPVLKAMDVPEDLLQSAMRFSLSALNTETEIDEAMRRIVEVVRRLRQMPTD
jgi:cysteine desulfurase